MGTTDWLPCIVTMFDLIGIRTEAASGKASSVMRLLQERAVAKMNHGMEHHCHCYVWNDSVLMLSYQAMSANARRRVLAELDECKQWLERECAGKLYAICVKGLAFPQDETLSPVYDGQAAGQARTVILKTSSWAMANCFEIEKRSSTTVQTGMSTAV
ncbi:hypothetical protein PQR72_13960 [Paraburkholderia madseniana]|uniref:hypothetical protein n=1 Tax=Paraburkholderia madseniana TaxID=2599607 RepID=UPI0019E24141|nr:hypothetical protein [Paraburkholderia madseniana]